MSLPEPPSPAGLGLVQFVRFARDPFAFLRAARLECGDLFTLELPIFGRIVCVASLEGLREASSRGDDELSAGTLHRHITGGLLGETSTFIADGEAHKQRQKLILKHLNSPNLSLHLPMIRRAVLKHLQDHLDGETVSLHDICDRVSLEIVGRVVWGETTDEETFLRLLDQFRELSDRGMRSILCQQPSLQKDWGPWSPWGRILRLERKTRQIFRDEVKRLRGSDYDTSSVLGQLLDAELGDDEIVDELFTLLFGGHETTSSAMTWAFFQVETHPEARTKLLAEIAEVLGERPLEPEDLERMPRLWAIVHETLRISPIGPFSGGRVALRDTELGGYRIREDTPLLFCPVTIAERDDVWDDAASFDADRFLEHSTRSSPNQVSFGRGRRICSGKKLALLETAAMLVTVYQQAEIELRHTKSDAQRRGLAWTPAGGLPIGLHSRGSRDTPHVAEA